MRARTGRLVLVGAFAVVGVAGGLIGAAIASPSSSSAASSGDGATGPAAGSAAACNVQLQELTLTKSPGDKVPVDYVRDGHSASATITLEAQP